MFLLRVTLVTPLVAINLRQASRKSHFQNPAIYMGEYYTLDRAIARFKLGCLRPCFSTHPAFWSA